MGWIENSSIWLVAIGKTTVHSLWIGILILALLKLILTFIPIRYSARRYNISVLALLVLFSSVIATFLILYKPVTLVPEKLVLPRVYSAIPWELLKEKLIDAGSRSGRMFTFFAYLYFAGILVMSARSFFSSQYLRGLRRNSVPIDPKYRERFLQLCNSLGIKRSVRFLQSTRVNSPMLLGYLKPAIIVPAGMFTHLPLNQVETILIHELYHLKRVDHLINLMQLFIEGVLFYHPVVWIISGQIRSEREHCCDDRVLKVTDNPLIYAKALIHLADQQQVPRLAPGAVGPGKYRLASRIRRIINTNAMKTNMRDKVLSLALLAGSVILLLAISGFSAGPSFFSIQRIYDEQITGTRGSQVIPGADTIPEKKEGIEEDEELELDMEVDTEVDMEVDSEVDVDSDVDREDLEKEMEAAREDARRAIEEIDWEQLQEEMEAAREDARRAMEEIDREQLKKEMEAAREDARRAMEEIDWEQLKKEMENNLSEMQIDVDKLKLDIENSMNEIDWDQIREELEKSTGFLDSIRIELDR